MKPVLPSLRQEQTPRLDGNWDKARSCQASAAARVPVAGMWELVSRGIVSALSCPCPGPASGPQPLGAPASFLPAVLWGQICLPPLKMTP